MSVAEPSSPDPQELGLLPWGAGLRLHLEAVDVGDGDDGGRHVPGQPHEGADGHEDAHPEEVQVVACGFLQHSTRQGRGDTAREALVFTPELCKVGIPLLVYPTVHPASPRCTLHGPDAPHVATRHPTLLCCTLYHPDALRIAMVHPVSLQCTPHCYTAPCIAMVHPVSP